MSQSQPGTSKDIYRDDDADASQRAMFKKSRTRGLMTSDRECENENEDDQVNTESDDSESEISDEDDNNRTKRKGRWKNGEWIPDIDRESEGEYNGGRQRGQFTYDPYIKLDVEQLKFVSHDMIKRADEYIQLYLDRYRCRRISKDAARQMLFAARLFGAPNAYFDKPNKIQKKLTEAYSKDMPTLFHRPINLKQFFESINRIEGRIGLRQWDFFFLSGQELLSAADQNQQIHKQEIKYFRSRIVNLLRILYDSSMCHDWSTAAECMAKIPLLPPKYQQSHSPLHFEYLSRSMSPYLPSIYLTALQALLESHQSIIQLSQQIAMAFHTFLATSRNSSRYPWLNHSPFYYSHLLIFHLVNLCLRRSLHGQEDLLTKARKAIKHEGNVEFRRLILLINYCIDVERHLLELNQNSQGKWRNENMKLQKIQDRPLANFFPQFMDTIFQTPQDSIGLLPLVVWCSLQFDCMEELYDKLLEGCTNYPYLLIHVYNVLIRFQQENVAGQLLGRLFDFCIDLLGTTPFILDLIEQRSLDPHSYGQFDTVISGNLRTLFIFLDQGRNRRDERAWAIMHANICYINDNEELMTALVKPQWEKRKDWWPYFHNNNVLLPTDQAMRMREEAFVMLNQLI